MMTNAYEIGRLQGALDLLDAIPPDSRLAALRNLCINNGVWCIPERAVDYQPCLYEIGAFGVTAHAQNPEDLPRHWMRAARNILSVDQAA